MTNDSPADVSKQQTLSDPRKQAPPRPVDAVIPLLGGTAGYCAATLLGFPF